jgi:hypothetical protein
MANAKPQIIRQFLLFAGAYVLLIALSFIVLSVLALFITLFL